jgi:hypothetical protein
MARLVESVAPDFGERLQWEKVVTKEMKGALRYGELSKSIGRPAPVPSIFINGKLVFEQTPSAEDLAGFLEKLIV